MAKRSSAKAMEQAPEDKKRVPITRRTKSQLEREVPKKKTKHLGGIAAAPHSVLLGQIQSSTYINASDLPDVTATKGTFKKVTLIADDSNWFERLLRRIARKILKEG
jgi:hypothetical protein